MNPDRLTRLLRDAPLPPSDPVRERVVAAARTEIAGSGAGRSPRPRRTVALLLAGCLLGVGFLTPPGRAAVDRAAELVGIGDGGGAPTQKGRRGFEEISKPVVVDNGRAPDGTRYEWVAYRGKLSYRVEDETVRFRGFCVGLEWPDSPRRESGGAECAGRGTPPKGPWEMSRIGYLQTPGAERGDPRDVMISGSTTPQVHGVRIVYTDLRGRAHDLTVDFARVDGKLLERAGGRRPFGTFMAFLPARQVAQDRLTKRFRIGSIVPPAPNRRRPLPDGPLTRCLKRYGHPPRVSPFEVTVSGRAGRVIEHARWREATIAPRRCQRLVQRLPAEAAPRH